MWDNPRLLNAMAGFLVGLVLLAFALAGMNWLLRASPFPVRTVEVITPLNHASRAQIEALLARQGRGNFFAAPIDDLRGAIERLPWVRSATVRRVWPDRLEIGIEEHVALARWGADALVNTYGERFAGSADEPLPVFSAPAGSEAEVTRRYERFSALVAPLASPIERVVLSARHAWSLRLANGLLLTLGRDADLAEQRLERFVEAYASTGGAGPVPQVVDLRYPNGFALRVKG
ncbi:MAG TPA: cell division protein FtsQ/DivIB [Burkholderiales bacterium]|nr:cell division protein FtsQ/DivIB [Burkholderiales bacterium]